MVSDSKNMIVEANPKVYGYYNIRKMAVFYQHIQMSKVIIIVLDKRIRFSRHFQNSKVIVILASGRKSD